MPRLYLFFKVVFGSKADDSNTVAAIANLEAWKKSFTQSVRRLEAESRAGRHRINWPVCMEAI
jgi:hypothetical protein